jgi:hypothetical protein
MKTVRYACVPSTRVVAHSCQSLRNACIDLLSVMFNVYVGYNSRSAKLSSNFGMMSGLESCHHITCTSSALVAFVRERLCLIIYTNPLQRMCIGR